MYDSAPYAINSSFEILIVMSQFSALMNRLILLPTYAPEGHGPLYLFLPVLEMR